MAISYVVNPRDPQAPHKFYAMAKSDTNYPYFYL